MGSRDRGVGGQWGTAGGGWGVGGGGWRYGWGVGDGVRGGRPGFK